MQESSTAAVTLPTAGRGERPEGIAKAGVPLSCKNPFAAVIKKIKKPK